MFWSQTLGYNKSEEDRLFRINDKEYILKGGILRQKDIYSDTQQQTKDTFGFKWEKRDTYESDVVKQSARNWLTDRYLGGDKSLLKKWLPDGAKLLDAGCGAGFSALLLFQEQLNNINYLGADISSAVEVASKRFAESNSKGEFIQASLAELPFNKPVFDVIFSEGVLHHTDSTEKSLKYLAGLLVEGGRFLFYVYKKKGPVREYTDDYIRNKLIPMSDEDAWNALMPLTKLGKLLGELNIQVDVPEEIGCLEIPAGSVDLQRLFYWHIFKAYYRPDWTLDEMNHVNFDWFRPLNCQRHTPEEIKRWCTEAGLTIERMDVQEAGITVVAIKQC